MADVCQSFSLIDMPRGARYAGELRIGSHSIGLSAVQFRIMEKLRKSGERFVNRDGILDAISKGRALEVTTVTVNISQLRKLLCDTPITIESAYGKGYRLTENDGTLKIARKHKRALSPPVQGHRTKPIVLPKPDIERLPEVVKRKYVPAPFVPRTCQWLEGEPRERNFCGLPVITGSSYCDAHHARCYERPSDVGEGRAA